MAIRSLETLAQAIRRAFGQVGPRAAQRMAMQMLLLEPDQFDNLLESMKIARKRIVRCSFCQNLTEREPCDVCRDPSRSAQLLCVVEGPQDVEAIEAAGFYKGLYHVVHGTIDPKFETPQANGSKKITLLELMDRLQNTSTIQEVILALDHDTEGELTALYIHQEIKRLLPGARVSRLGVGVPFGGEVLYADTRTLREALERRTVLKGS